MGTFVLVHGGFHGGWCWRQVAARLRARDHNVYTPTQTGCGERSHLLSKSITLDTFVDDIANAFIWEDLHEVVHRPGFCRASDQPRLGQGQWHEDGRTQDRTRRHDHRPGPAGRPAGAPGPA